MANLFSLTYPQFEKVWNLQVFPVISCNQTRKCQWDIRYALVINKQVRLVRGRVPQPSITWGGWGVLHDNDNDADVTP